MMQEERSVLLSMAELAVCLSALHDEIPVHNAMDFTDSTVNATTVAPVTRFLLPPCTAVHRPREDGAAPLPAEQQPAAALPPRAPPPSPAAASLEEPEDPAPDGEDPTSSPGAAAGGGAPAPLEVSVDTGASRRGGLARAAFIAGLMALLAFLR